MYFQRVKLENIIGGGMRIFVRRKYPQRSALARKGDPTTYLSGQRRDLNGVRVLRPKKRDRNGV